MPGAVASGLSSLCSTLLGVDSSGRRRLAEAPFTLKVDFYQNSFVSDIKEIQFTEEAIMDELHIIEDNEDVIIQNGNILRETILGIESDIQEIKASLSTGPWTQTGCGNKECDLDETNKNCPADCVDAQLDTTSSSKAMSMSSEKIHFAIKAKRSIDIKSLSFYTSIARSSVVTVRMQEGENSEGIFSSWDQDSWKEVFRSNVSTGGYNASGNASLTKVTFSQAIAIPSGQTATFEMHSASSNIIVHGENQEGKRAAQNSALEVHVGRDSNNHPVSFAGILVYDGVEPGSSSAGRSKTAKAKTAKMEKDDRLLEADSMANANKETLTLDLDGVKFDIINAMDATMNAMDTKIMNAIDANMNAIDAKMKAMEGMIGQLLEQNKKLFEIISVTGVNSQLEDNL